MSNLFEIYDEYFHLGLFTKDDLKLFVEVGFITADEEVKIESR